MLNDLNTPFRRWVEDTPMSRNLYYSLLRYDKLYPMGSNDKVDKQKFLALKGIGIKRWEEYERIWGKW